MLNIVTFVCLFLFGFCVSIVFAMIYYFFGIITGMLVSLSILLIEIRREVRSKETIFQKIERQIVKSSQGGVHILEPLSDLDEANQAIFDKNDLQGKDTNMTELDEYD